MKVRFKKQICIILAVILTFCLTGCGRGYSYTSYFGVKVKGCISSSLYVGTHRFPGFIYSVSPQTHWGGFFYKNSLSTVANVRYFHAAEKHSLIYNLYDKKIYDDKMLGYADTYAAELVSEAMGIEKGEKLFVRYNPCFNIQTERIDNFSKHPTTEKYDFFPSDYTKENVEAYVNDNYLENRYYEWVHIYSPKTCMEYEAIVDLKTFTGFDFKRIGLIVFSEDGYVHYRYDYSDDNPLNTDEDHRDILVTVYAKKDFVIEDKIKVEYYNTYEHRYHYNRFAEEYDETDVTAHEYSQNSFEPHYNANSMFFFDMNLVTPCDIYVKDMKKNKICTLATDRYSNYDTKSFKEQKQTKMGDWYLLGNYYGQNKEIEMNCYLPFEDDRCFKEDTFMHKNNHLVCLKK